MRLPLRRSALALLLALGPGAWLQARQAPAAAAPAPDYAALLGPFPAPGSEREQADQAVLLWEQRVRTREDIRRAESEVDLQLGLFAAATGRELGRDRFPLTQGLVDAAVASERPVLGALKRLFARPRPYEVMPGLSPAVPRENTGSYPSGHSTWGTLVASLLVQLEPKAREAILERGLQVGFDRVLGGVHNPSDVEAGQRLGFALAQAWLAVPGNRARLEQARAAEW